MLQQAAPKQHLSVGTLVSHRIICRYRPAIFSYSSFHVSYEAAVFWLLYSLCFSFVCSFVAYTRHVMATLQK